MQTIGIIGGMSWESTASYYQLLNQGVKQQLGGLHSAKLNLHSVDFAEIEELQHQGNWQALGKRMADAARKLEAAESDFIIIATNTMHKLAEQVTAAVSIPLLHIADATAQRLKEQGIDRVGLLGTAFTMEQDFYKQRLIDAGIEVVIPIAEQRQEVHRIIYQELCQGEIRQSSRECYQEVITSMSMAGIGGVILGCTEIGLLIQQEHSTLPLFDTTSIHAEAAVKRAIA